MDFSSATIWWVLAGILVATELLTGTFYLLMLAVGALGGALSTSMGLSLSGQLTTAALLGGGATALWHWHRAKQPRSAPAQMNRDVNMDIGEPVKVTAWDENRQARVSHRGTWWTARLSPDETNAEAHHYIISAIEGNCLIVRAAPTPTSHT